MLANVWGALRVSMDPEFGFAFVAAGETVEAESDAFVTRRTYVVSPQGDVREPQTCRSASCDRHHLGGPLAYCDVCRERAF
jgi:hypothetical protein